MLKNNRAYSNLKDKVKYSSFSLSRVIATVLAGTAFGLGIFLLMSPAWIRKDFAVSKIYLESGHVEFGVLTRCITIPAQGQTLNRNLGTECGPYGKDIGADWPSGSWAAAVTLQGIGMVFMLFAFLSGIITPFTVYSLDSFATSAAAMGSLLYICCILCVFGGLGGQIALDKVFLFADVCYQGGPFNFGSDCSMQYGMFLAIANALIAVCCTVAFVDSAMSKYGTGAYV